MRNLPTPLRIYAAVAILLVSIVAVFVGREQDRRASATLRAEGRAVLAEQRADSVLRANKALADGVTVIVAQRDSALAVADSLAARTPAVRVVYRERAARSTDTLLVAAADSALALADTLIATQGYALSECDSALAITLTRAYNAEQALAFSKSSLTDLRRSVERERSARRVAALIPKLGAGVAIGLDHSGRPNTVVGLTFGWRF